MRCRHHHHDNGGGEGLGPQPLKVPALYGSPRRSLVRSVIGDLIVLEAVGPHLVAAHSRSDLTLAFLGLGQIKTGAQVGKNAALQLGAGLGLAVLSGPAFSLGR